LLVAHKFLKTKSKNTFTFGWVLSHFPCCLYGYMAVHD